MLLLCRTCIRRTYRNNYDMEDPFTSGWRCMFGNIKMNALETLEPALRSVKSYLCSPGSSKLFWQILSHASQNLLVTWGLTIFLLPKHRVIVPPCQSRDKIFFSIHTSRQQGSLNLSSLATLSVCSNCIPFMSFCSQIRQFRKPSIKHV